MKENLKDILSNLQPGVDQEELLKYLEGKLSAEEQHEVEKNTMDDAFETDALEGLQNIQNKARINALVEQLNRDLKKKTAKKKRWAHKREARLEPSILIAIILILAIAVIGYFIIRTMKGH
jgi:anti-sigma factor RsiW